MLEIKFFMANMLLDLGLIKSWSYVAETKGVCVVWFWQ